MWCAQNVRTKPPSGSRKSATRTSGFSKPNGISTRAISSAENGRSKYSRRSWPGGTSRCSGSVADTRRRSASCRRSNSESASCNASRFTEPESRAAKGIRCTRLSSCSRCRNHRRIWLDESGNFSFAGPADKRSTGAVAPSMNRASFRTEQ